MLSGRKKSLVFFICLALAAINCKNEPYENPTLGVSQLTSARPTTRRSFHYHSMQLDAYTFTEGTTSSSMKLYYSGDQVTHITYDSIETSKKISVLHYNGINHIDTLKLIDAAGTHILSIRSVTYNDAGKPVSVNVKTITETGVTEKLAELTWQDDNVVRLVNSDLSTGEKVLTGDVTIVYDSAPCVYATGPDYLFTLSLEDLFWLSKNNPASFQQGEVTKEYTFWYNKIGYPSAFQVDTVTYEVSYVQVR